MMGNWKTCTIGDLGRVVGGATPSTKKAENYDGGTIAWITPKDLAGFSGRFISRGERNITEQGLKSCSTQLMPAHTVLFSSRAPIGYIAIAEQEVCTNQGFKNVVPDEKTDYMFLYYLLKYNKEKIENLGSGTTFKEVSGSTMRGIEVRVPETIEEQQRIASVLSALDDKIEKNTEVNENLQAQVKALFHAMFISSEDRLSWKNGTFSDLIESTLGGDWGKESPTGNNTEMVYCIRGADIPEVKAGNKGKMPTRYILPKNYAAKRLLPGDIVVEISGGSPTQSTGRVAAISQSLLDRYDKGMVCTNFCRAIKPKSGYSMFIYYYWQHLYDRNVFFSYENGTTGIKNLDLSGFITTEEIVIPPFELIQKFDDYCQIVFDQTFANGLENEQLSNLRDTLLPQLMSGELDVTDIEI